MVGAKFKQVRLAHNLTQKEFAKILCVSTSCIGMYEHDKRMPSKDIIKIFCDKFGYSLDELLAGPLNEDAELSIDEVIENMKKILVSQKGLMFDGVLITDNEEIEMIFEAMRVGKKRVLGINV